MKCALKKILEKDKSMCYFGFVNEDVQHVDEKVTLP